MGSVPKARSASAVVWVENRTLGPALEVLLDFGTASRTAINRFCQLA